METVGTFLITLSSNAPYMNVAFQDINDGYTFYVDKNTLTPSQGAVVDPGTAGVPDGDQFQLWLGNWDPGSSTWSPTFRVNTYTYQSGNPAQLQLDFNYVPATWDVITL